MPHPPRAQRRKLGALTACVVAGALVTSGCGGQQPSAEAKTDGEAAATRSEDTALALARFDELYTRYASNPGDSRQRKQFRDAFGRIRAEYVRTVPDTVLIEAAIAGIEEKDLEPGKVAPRELVDTALDAMTASLDPHSTYLNPEELRDTEISLTGRFGGLGIRVAREEGVIRVISPIEGTPADRAGLEAGDLITHVDGAPVAEMSLMQAVNTMRGDPGSRIRLTIQRAKKRPFDVTITRAVINIRPARWDTFGTVGYLRIVNFNVNSAREVDDAVKQIRAKLGDRMTGLVIDLRRNPGGAFGQSVRIADSFIDEGVIVSVRGRDGQRLRDYRASPGDVVDGLPVIVLIDGGSASASEIVASALQDQGRATIMGRQSFGKGSVQTLLRLPTEGAVKLTTALYYAPSGRSIQARGVTPDVRLIVPDEAPQDDTPEEARRREADLPKAFPTTGRDWSDPSSKIDTVDCPALGDDDDRELGCAIEVLNAGSVEGFLSRTTPGAGGSG